MSRCATSTKVGKAESRYGEASRGLGVEQEPVCLGYHPRERRPRPIFLLPQAVESRHPNALSPVESG